MHCSRLKDIGFLWARHLGGALKDTIARDFCQIFIVNVTYIDVAISFIYIFRNNISYRTIAMSIMFYAIECFLTILFFMYIERILPHKFCIAIKNIIVMISAIMFLSDSFLLYKFGEVLDVNKTIILFKTNIYTVEEFIKLYLLSSISDNMIGCGLFFVVVLIIYKNKGTFINLKKRIIIIVQNKIAVMISAVGTSIITLAILAKFDWATLLCLSIWLCPSCRMIGTIYACSSTLTTSQQAEYYLSNNAEKIIATNDKPDNVIFILGESMNRNKLMVYGNKNANTPCMMNRIKSNNALVFRDVIAPANNTSSAQKQIWTFAEKGDQLEWYKQGDLVDIMHDAGYHTYWLSNQCPYSLFGNEDEIFASRSDRYFFGNTSHSGNSDESAWDGVLLPELGNYLSEKKEYNFIVVHLEGEHEIFKLRYPPEFSHFTADDEVGKDTEQRQIKAEYDNAILYSDYIIDEIIKCFEDKDAVVIYISDHGLEVYDDRDFVGHSSEDIGSRQMIEIPMIIWGSDKYWQKRPELKNLVMAAVDRPYMTDDIIHTVLDLASIQSTSYDPAKSIINSRFDASRVRMYHGEPYQKEDDD